MCCHVLLNGPRRKIQNFWNVPFPPVWVEKSSDWISSLKDPHVLCTFHKEIYLLEEIIAGICFVLVCGRQDCSEGRCVSRGSQDTMKSADLGLILNWFSFIWAILGLESAISTWIVVLHTWNYFFQPSGEFIWRGYICHLEILSS